MAIRIGARPGGSTLDLKNAGDALFEPDCGAGRGRPGTCLPCLQRIASVLIGSFPLLPSALLAVAAAVLTGTVSPAKAFAGFANASVLLVVIAFLVAIAVVKSDLGRRISLLMVSLFGQSSIGLAYSIVITDALIALGFPSNTARGGVLFPIVLSVATGSGSRPDDPKGRRLGGYLMFCGIQPSPSSAVPPAPSPISTLRTNPPTTPLKTPAVAVNNG